MDMQSTQTRQAAPVRLRLPQTPDPMHRCGGWGGVQIAADEWGRRGAPLAILLHGGGQTRHAWRDTGERLGAAGWHAVAFDARGHGDSDWAPDADYGIDAMVRDLQCVVAAFGGGRPVLVGASMGGITGLVAAGEGHVDAAALILVDVVPYTEPAGAKRVHSFINQRPDGFGTLEEVARAIADYRGGRRPGNGDLSGLAKNVRVGADGRYYWHFDPRFAQGPRDFEARHARLVAAARELRQPALLVRGAMSDVVSEQGVREFLALCPQAEYVNIASAGHMVTGDRNDAFGRAAEEFLGRIVPPGHDVQSTPPDPPG